MRLRVIVRWGSRKILSLKAGERTSVSCASSRTSVVSSQCSPETETHIHMPKFSLAKLDRRLYSAADHVFAIRSKGPDQNRCVRSCHDVQTDFFGALFA